MPFRQRARKIARLRPEFGTNRFHENPGDGCCAGNACHEEGDFYLLLEVRGFEGIQRLRAWLSLSQAAGCKECFDGPRVAAFMLPDIEMVMPDHLRGYDLSASPFMGGEWVRVNLRLDRRNGCPTREETLGGIHALNQGWKALIRQYGRGNRHLLAS